MWVIVRSTIVKPGLYRIYYESQNLFYFRAKIGNISLRTIYFHLFLFLFVFQKKNKKTVSVRGKVFQIVARSREYGSKTATDTAFESFNTESASASIAIASIVTAIIHFNYIRFIRWWWCWCWRRVARLSRAQASSPSMILKDLINSL